jgi:hypothetical protein
MVGNIDGGNEIVEETDSTKLVRDGNGALLRWRKDQSGAAEYVDVLVKKQADWEKHIRPGLLDGSSYERRIDLQVDHSVSSQVNYETYSYFVNKGLEIGTY